MVSGLWDSDEEDESGEDEPQGSPSGFPQQRFWYEDIENAGEREKMLRDTPEDERIFQQAMFEIYSSEKDYIRDLEIVIQVPPTHYPCLTTHTLSHPPILFSVTWSPCSSRVC